MNPSDVDILGFLRCESKMYTFSAANGTWLGFPRATCTAATIVAWVRTGCVVHLLEFLAGRDPTVFDHVLLYKVRHVDGVPIDATRHLIHRFVARGAMSQDRLAFAFRGHRVWYSTRFVFVLLRTKGKNVVHRKRKSRRNRDHNSLRNFERIALGNRVGLVDRHTIDRDHTHSIRHT